MTSNVGARAFSGVTVVDKQIRQKVEGELRAQFKPEFLNRVDEIIVFNQLGLEQVEKIVELQLERVKERLAQQNITLIATSKAKELLAREGFDPTFGARPVKRAIQDRVVNPLSLEVLEGKIRAGEIVELQVADSNSGSFAFKLVK